MKKDKVVSATELKAKFSKFLARACKTGSSLTVTKHGRPVARLIPLENEHSKPVPGKLESVWVSETDIVAPIGSEDWNSSK